MSLKRLAWSWARRSAIDCSAGDRSSTARAGARSAAARERRHAPAAWCRWSRRSARWQPGGVLERREARGHLAHAAQVRQQVVELEHQRQEVVAGELRALLAIAHHVLERVHAAGDALEVQCRGLALDGVQLAEQAGELLAELRVGARRLLEDRVDQLQAGLGRVEERDQLQRVDVHHAEHHVQLLRWRSPASRAARGPAARWR